VETRTGVRPLRPGSLPPALAHPHQPRASYSPRPTQVHRRKAFRRVRVGPGFRRLAHLLTDTHRRHPGPCLPPRRRGCPGPTVQRPQSARSGAMTQRHGPKYQLMQDDMWVLGTSPRMTALGFTGGTIFRSHPGRSEAKTRDPGARSPTSACGSQHQNSSVVPAQAGTQASVGFCWDNVRSWQAARWNAPCRLAGCKLGSPPSRRCQRRSQCRPGSRPVSCLHCCALHRARDDSSGFGRRHHIPLSSRANRSGDPVPRGGVDEHRSKVIMLAA
jgi:hypothetical protein